LNKILAYVQWSALPIAIAAAIWSMLVYQALQKPVDIIIVAIAFTSCWFYYSRDRLQYSESERINSNERYKWSNKYLSLLNKFALIILIALIIFRIRILIPAAIGGIMALLYGKTLTLGKLKLNIKKLPGGKIIFVGILWIILIVFFPVFNEAIYPFSRVVFLLVSYFSLIIFTIIVISDIKDIEGDKAEGINTLAVLYGASAVRNICILALLLSVIPGYLLFEIPILFLSTLILIILVLFHDKLIA